MDGSARPFVLLIECAGTVEQDQPVRALRAVATCRGEFRRGYARLEPARGLELVVEVPQACQGRPFAIMVSPEACKSDLVDARAASVARCTPRRSAWRTRRRGTRRLRLGALALVPARSRRATSQSGADAHLRCQLLRRLLADRGNWRLTGERRAGEVGCTPPPLPRLSWPTLPNGHRLPGGHQRGPTSLGEPREARARFEPPDRHRPNQAWASRAALFPAASQSQRPAPGSPGRRASRSNH